MAFLIGALPALYVCLIRLHMPESVRYLLAHGRVDEARKIVVSIEKALNVPVAPFTDKDKQLPAVATASFRELWKKPFISRTVMLWLVWFASTSATMHLHVAAVPRIPAGIHRRQDL